MKRSLTWKLCTKLKDWSITTNHKIITGVAYRIRGICERI